MFYEYWAPVLICSLASLAVALILCLPYGRKSRDAAADLEYTAGKLDKQKRCKMENMHTIGLRVGKTGNGAIKEIWARFSTDAETLFNDENVPDPRAYFTYEDIFAIPGREKLLSVLQGILPTFAVLSLAAPFVALFFAQADITTERIRAAIAAACSGIFLVAAVYIVSFMYIRRINQRNDTALAHFNRTLSALLPILSETTQAAFLLRASRQNSEAFIETAKIIAKKIDDFAVQGITPLVTGAFEKSITQNLSPTLIRLEDGLSKLSQAVLQQQENGMQALATAFAENLNGTVTTQLKTMTADMETMVQQLNAMRQSMEEASAKLLENLNADSAVLKETANISRSVAWQHELTRQNIGEMTEALSRTEQLIGKIDVRDEDVFTRLSTAYERIQSLQDQFENQLRAMDAITETVSEKMVSTSAAVSESTRQLIASANETSERTYALISEKIAAVLDETNTANAETYDKINTANAETYEKISAANTEAYGKISAAVQYLIDETGKAADAGFDRVWQKLSETFENLNTSNSETYSRISQSVESLSASVGETVRGAFSTYSEQLISVMNDTVASNNDTSKKLAVTMDSLALAGTEQYEKAAKAAAQLLENVVVEMNKAMDGVGHEIADSITQASLGSAEIVHRLAEKTEELKEQYDTYFSRVEEQNNNNLSEMEFRIQNIFSRFSNDAEGVMDRLEGNISKAVELFQGNTTLLLQSLEEQSRSIGLYAKDLNIDVASLTASLRESVGIFTEHLQNSTRKTFSEFDDGLTEVNARLANTVESIRESIENLPAMLGGNK